jgi:PPOX class probable F420-dependent enzyme
MELHDALEFIRDRHRGVLVTLKQDGRPQLSNIGYGFGNDGVIRVSVTDSRAKTKNARRDPRVALYVTSDDFYAYAVVEGRAELSPVAAEPTDATVDELIELYRNVAGEHPDWDDFRKAMVADGRLILRLHPERAYGMLPVAEG